MSPPISKEWWLAAALTGAAATPALGQQVASIDRKQIGVVTSVQPGAPGQPGSVQSAPLVADGTRDQRITNDTNAPMHVMFADQSAITIGPNSAVILKDFNYNAEQKSGNIALELTKGVMRVVGGFISKKNPVSVVTKTATIGVRGGISIVRADDDKTEAAFLYGDAMEVTPTRQPRAVSAADDPLAELGDPAADEGFGAGQSGPGPAPTPIVITVPGFKVDVTFTGLDVSKLTAGQLSQLTAALSTIVQQITSKPAAPAPTPTTTPGKPAAAPPPATITRTTTVPLTVPIPFVPTAVTIQIPVTISVRQLTGSTAQGS